MVTIPTLPEVVTKVNAMVGDSKVSIQEIGDVIAQDAPISAKVLRIANSAVYGLAEPATSVVEAAKVVGARALRNIALQASVIQRYAPLSSIPDFDIHGVWKHAIFTGQLAQKIGAVAKAAVGEFTVDEFYTCGLIHDIGKVVMLESLSEDYLEVFRRARATQQPIHICEQDVFGFNHTEVGAVVAQQWQFAESVSKVIQFHHGPRQMVEEDPIVAVVAIADQISYRIELDNFDDAKKRIEALAKRVLGVEAEAMEEIYDYGLEILPLIEV